MFRILSCFFALYAVALHAQHVGIGTSTPNARLEVKGLGNTSSTQAVEVKNSDGNTIFSINDAMRTGINTSNPDSSSVLEISSTTGGFLLPRMTTAQYQAIPNPAMGLLIFNTDDAMFYYYTGSQWIALQSGQGGGSGNFSHYIGESFGGGVIFHLWKDNLGLEHGLIVAPNDISTSSPYSNVSGTLIGPSAQSLWDGLANSNAIVAQPGHINSAAKLCLDLVSGGFSDWYLPAFDEWGYLWQNRFNVNKTLSTINGADLLKTVEYWSSTEYSSGSAFYYAFYGINLNKSIHEYVRAIRSF